MTTLRNLLFDPEVWKPLVAPDGNHAAWLSTISGRPAIHVKPINGGEEQILAHDALSGHPFSCYCWALDSKSVWLLHVPDDDLTQTELRKVALSGAVLSETSLGGWSWLHGTTEAGVIISDWDRTVADSGDLFQIDPETGHRDQLTQYGARVGSVTVNPDGRLAYRIPDQGDETANGPGEVAVIRDADGTLTPLEGDVHPVAWQGDQLLLADSSEDDRVGIRKKSGDVEWFGTGTPVGFLGSSKPLALRDGTPVILPRGQSLTWNREPANEGATGNRSAVFTTKGTESAPANIVSWKEETTTTLSAPEYRVPPTDLTDPGSVTYTDSTGEDCNAWLLVPDDRPAPCIVHLYGAVPEAGDFGRKFGRPFQYLHESGYAVLVPAHGGDRFSDRRHADYAAAAKWVREQAWSNGQVVALGHSSGGYDVLMQATHTPESWGAGIAWNGIADFRGFYEVMAKSRERIEQQLEDHGLARLDELSPIHKPDEVGFPLLVIQGEQDWMTDQVRDFVTEARAEGASIAYEEIPGMAHWTRDLDLKVRVWETIETFLEQSFSDQTLGD